MLPRVVLMVALVFSIASSSVVKLPEISSIAPLTFSPSPFMVQVLRTHATVTLGWW